jgi:hypothetical protein
MSCIDGLVLDGFSNVHKDMKLFWIVGGRSVTPAS